jgi:hypothetical protein
MIPTLVFISKPMDHAALLFNIAGKAEFDV